MFETMCHRVVLLACTLSFAVNFMLYILQISIKPHILYFIIKIILFLKNEKERIEDSSQCKGILRTR